MTEEGLFHGPREQAAGGRAAFLADACAGDAALRRRIELLLHAHENPGSFLARPAVSRDTAAGPPPDPRAAERAAQSSSRRVGPYKLLQRLGMGGMGAV